MKIVFPRDVEVGSLFKDRETGHTWKRLADNDSRVPLAPRDVPWFVLVKVGRWNPDYAEGETVRWLSPGIGGFAVMEKERLYKTAFSPQFNCYVRIDHAWQDDRGEWIFKCSNPAEGLEGMLFRANELTRFCL